MHPETDEEFEARWDRITKRADRNVLYAKILVIVSFCLVAAAVGNAVFAVFSSCGGGE